MDNLNLYIATKNGTGSLFANQLLTKLLFRAGWSVGSYNFFPSNIAGLPCLYCLRLNSKSYTSFEDQTDVLLQLHPSSFFENLTYIKKTSLIIFNKKDSLKELWRKKIETSLPHEPCFKDMFLHTSHWDLPITESVQQIQSASVKTKPLFQNMIYVGLFCEFFKIDQELMDQTVKDVFQDSINSQLLQNNYQALRIGRDLAKQKQFPFKIPKKTRQITSASTSQDTSTDILIDGNTSMALGASSAGCQFLSWYPITPASSLAESFEKFSMLYQVNKKGQKKFQVVQAEDELASLAHVIGASWAGLRAMTVSSGPGLSLMSEAAGLAYFAEIPSVICNIQRAGPSTGLPTRSQQSDFLSACFLSHGDSKHLVLIPGNPEEAFKFTAQAFDLAERLQTLVIVLSDLDLGMNLKISTSFEVLKQDLQRGKVLDETSLNTNTYNPYGDPDKDGISYRTLPGIRHTKGAYLNRGSGHNQKAEYSENPQEYSWKLDKLERKWQTAKSLMPKSVIEFSKHNRIAFVTFGSNEPSIKEMRADLKLQNISTNFLRLCSFPFSNDVESFLEKHDDIFVVEQNQQAQLKKVLQGEFPKQSSKMKSLLQYDGRPLIVSRLKQQFYKQYSKTKTKTKTKTKPSL